MKCFYCEQEFALNGKQGGQNRMFCYNCMPEGLSRPDRNSLRYQLIKSKLDEIKLSRGCSSCGYNKCPRALEWHHPNNDKISDPSNLMKGGSVTKYLEEIDKCILLCANCHREVHFFGE